MAQAIKLTNKESGEILYFPSINQATKHGFVRSKIRRCLFKLQKVHYGFLVEAIDNIPPLPL